MSLLDEVERVLGNLAQEVSSEASVLVQFAAGDWAKLKAAFHAEKEAVTPVPAPELFEEQPIEPVPAPVEATETTETPSA